MRLQIRSLSSDDARRHRRRRPRAALAVVAVALTVLAAGCAPEDEAGAEPSASGSVSCPPGKLDTVKPGTMTIATGKPAYPPWFSNDDPSNGKGYESAVAYAVSSYLGYQKPQVTWVSADFNAAIAPGAKPYDLNLQQISITDERKQAVDFSSGYYDVAQAFVGLKSGKAANAKTIADLKQLQLGAASATTSYDAIVNVVKPVKPARPFNDNDQAKLALSNGQIDALAVDLPTAFYLAGAELDDGFVVGQLPITGTAPEQFGIVLEKGSPLTACVSQAVDALREQGTLSLLKDQWLSGTAGAPVLT